MAGVEMTLEHLEAGLDHVRNAPTGEGRLELLVRRPAEGEREVLDEGRLDLVVGLVGDSWLARGSRTTAHRRADPDGQINLMGARAAALIAGPLDRWPLAGDQLFVDLDLSGGHLPAGSQIAVGDAVIEITAKPHRGCAKFSARFGADALRFVNSPEGVALNLRGRNAKVLVPGLIRTGDQVVRLG
jgi:hypothetical protein